MLRRSIREISSRRPVSRIQKQMATQIPSYLSSRKFSSVLPQQNEPKGSGGKKNFMPYILGVFIGGAGYGAYRLGYFEDLLHVKEQHSDDSANVATFNKDSTDDIQLDNKTYIPSFQEESKGLEPVPEEGPELALEKGPEPALEKGPEPVLEEGQHQVLGNGPLPVLEKEPQSALEKGPELAEPVHGKGQEDILLKGPGLALDKGPGLDPEKLPEQVLKKLPETVVERGAEPVHEINSNLVQEKKSPSSPQTETSTEDNAVQKDEKKSNFSEVPHSNDEIQLSSLLDAYLLKDSISDSPSDASSAHKDLVEEMESEGLAFVADDGKLVLDFIQAIHTAEKRQAELDARVHSEEKRMIKDKYEKNLKDARARELMYAEREAILDKELNKEKVKSAAALKSLQETYEEKLKMEREQKETEKELELKRTQELAKLELAAAIASEKASQIEKMAEANLDIIALCMAFYARSEEARQSHSVHKLALGALALEEALSKGLPIQKEVDALQNYLQGVDKDSVLDLILSSLPQETRTHGTDTLLQLNNKFDSLKGTLRHFVLIPPGGGGILTHSLAHVASLLKVRESDKSGEGIESLINKVENLLDKGKILEAANTLEDGLKGSQAENVVSDWLKSARNRAITEQALTLIQSYATSISLT